MTGVFKSLMILLLLFLAVPAEAGFTYGFYGITGNSSEDVVIGERQLSVTLAGRKDNRVRIRFDNAGLDAASITDVYFDDALGVFDSIHSIKKTPGVSFSEGANPGNLPGGNLLDPGFQSTLGLNADSDPPVEINGVNPDEKLVLTMQIASEFALSDVIDAINASALRIGLHVQGFESGGSESFVNMTSDNPPPVVPEPSGLALAGLAALVLIVANRRRTAVSQTDSGLSSPL